MPERGDCRPFPPSKAFKVTKMRPARTQILGPIFHHLCLFLLSLSPKIMLISVKNKKSKQVIYKIIKAYCALEQI